MRKVESDTFERLERRLTGKTANGGPKRLAKGTKVTKDYLGTVERYDWFDIRLANEEAAAQVEGLKESLAQKRREFDAMFEAKRKKLTPGGRDRKSTRLNSSHRCISYAVFCLKKKKTEQKKKYEN